MSAGRGVVLYGLGPIGRAAAKHLAEERPEERIVAAIDPSPELVGRSVRALLGAGPDDVRVVARLADAGPALAAADVALHAAGSRLRDIGGQLEELLAAGLHVVSSSEELTLPELGDAAAAAALDAAARRAGRSVLGTGINPGFLMDALPVFLSNACLRVRAVRCERIVNLSRRRGPLRKKMGVGLTRAEFEARAARPGRDGLGHVGLPESALYVARRLGAPLAELRLDERFGPVADAAPDAPVRGTDHHVAAWRSGRALVSLSLRMELDAPSEFDLVDLDGDPPVRARLEGGVHGDSATAALLVHGIDAARAAAPGWHASGDLAAAPSRWAD